MSSLLSLWFTFDNDTCIRWLTVFNFNQDPWLLHVFRTGRLRHQYKSRSYIWFLNKKVTKVKEIQSMFIKRFLCVKFHRTEIFTVSLLESNFKIQRMTMIKSDFFLCFNITTLYLFRNLEGLSNSRFCKYHKHFKDRKIRILSYIGSC